MKKFRLTSAMGFPSNYKKMFWKGIVEELLFFIRGNTNSRFEEKESRYGKETLLKNL